MNNTLIIETEKWVENFMEEYDSSHNFKHVLRVKKLAISIAKSEKLKDNDIFEVILAAITHDIADHKYINPNDKNTQEKILTEYFTDKLDDNIVKNIVFIACNTSLSKEVSFIDKFKDIDDNLNIKLKCVQDADRIDSLGSIGIARYFIYGIVKNKSDMEDIIDNLENRTNILLQHIKTKKGIKLSKKKYKIVKIFIHDFRNSI